MSNLQIGKITKPYNYLVEKVEGVVVDVEGSFEKRKIRGQIREPYTKLGLQTDSPTKRIIFPGWPPVFPGERLTAYVFSGRQVDKHYERCLTPIPFQYRVIPVFGRRELDEQETADRIEIFSDKGTRVYGEISERLIFVSE